LWPGNIKGRAHEKNWRRYEHNIKAFVRGEGVNVIQLAWLVLRQTAALALFEDQSTSRRESV
jgi:hypothetical protein